VFCNGGAAFQLFRRHVQRRLPAPQRDLPVRQLPSTSPANAGMRPQQKLARWREELGPWLG